ncbi:unnamed protein product [Lampetra fluviatilis]
MAMEGEPGFVVKFLYLLTLSTAWGMGIWVTFISGLIMRQHLPRQWLRSVQGLLFPIYFMLGSCCSILNLALFALYHPREALDTQEVVQVRCRNLLLASNAEITDGVGFSLPRKWRTMWLWLVSVVSWALNARWFSDTTIASLEKMTAIEIEHGILGQEPTQPINKEGPPSGQSQNAQDMKEKCAQLEERDQKYSRAVGRFRRYHKASLFANFVSLGCTGISLALVAQHLRAL